MEAATQHQLNQQWRSHLSCLVVVMKVMRVGEVMMMMVTSAVLQQELKGTMQVGSYTMHLYYTMQ